MAPCTSACTPASRRFVACCTPPVHLTTSRASCLARPQGASGQALRPKMRAVCSKRFRCLLVHLTVVRCTLMQTTGGDRKRRTTRPGSALEPHRSVAATTRRGPRLSHLAREDVATDVERDSTTIVELFPEERSSTLHARLHAGDRDTEHLCCLFLRQPFELGQGQRFAIGRRQRCHEERRVSGHLFFSAAIVVVALGRKLRFGFARSAQDPMLRLQALMVDDGAARDAIDPGAEALVVAQVSETALHAQEDIL